VGLLAALDAERLAAIELDIGQRVVEARTALAIMSAAIGLPRPGELTVREANEPI
jgi:hypothetical protein